MKKLKLGIPKGSLFKKTIELLKRVGIEVKVNGRDFQAEITGTEIFEQGFIFRPEDIPVAIDRGIVNCGITGWDMIVEADMEKKLAKIIELNYSKTKTNDSVKIVVFGKIRQLIDNESIIVSAEYPNLAKRVFKKARIVFSTGTTEAKVATDLYDYGVGVVETGQSLRDNNLQILKTILISPVVLLAKERSSEMESFGRLLRGGLDALQYKLVKMDVGEDIKKVVLDILPAIQSPTVSTLADGSFAIETVCQKDEVADLIMKLQQFGAKGIVVQDMNILL